MAIKQVVNHSMKAIMSNVIIKVYQSKNRIKSTEQLNQTNQMTYIKRFRLASSTCRFFVYEVGRIACLGYSVVSLHHPVYQKQARGAHMSKSLSFFDFGWGPLGGLLRREKNVPGTLFR